ncbi:MAG: hypothetical protein IKA53_00860 [Clostridia bacterium]|nr:hypothetical protein [Clostridia bacterium]MBR2324573.1 hypothetical protein [Clostridia bacterium]
MKLNQEQLKRLSALSDAELEREIRRIAAEKGLKLPAASFAHEDLEKLRALLTSEGGFGMMGAMRYYNEYKKKYGK